MSSAGAAGARVSAERERGRRGLRRRRAPPPYIGRGAAACAAALTSRECGWRAPGRPAPPRLPAPRARRCRGAPAPAGPRGGRRGLSPLRGVCAPFSARQIARASPGGAVRTGGRAGGAPRPATCAGSGGGAPPGRRERPAAAPRCDTARGVTRPCRGSLRAAAAVRASIRAIPGAAEPGSREMPGGADEPGFQARNGMTTQRTAPLSLWQEILWNSCFSRNLSIMI
ncbi:translation initiation factor IF-2-like [Vidua chalybeata]|uniref:translation initiation factor IF-2-like n=1 Tax=Vidua chalybeata TaxID=81927 RepID=UPI0023A8327C|nr:translation initiation factor IF-2-like [Vidua chalybeata]